MIRLVILRLTLLLCTSAGFTEAQSGQVEPLSLPWTDPGLGFYAGPDGCDQGFGIALKPMFGMEVDPNIELFRGLRSFDSTDLTGTPVGMLGVGASTNPARLICEATVYFLKTVTAIPSALSGVMPVLSIKAVIVEIDVDGWLARFLRHDSLLPFDVSKNALKAEAFDTTQYSTTNQAGLERGFASFGVRSGIDIVGFGSRQVQQDLHTASSYYLAVDEYSVQQVQYFGEPDAWIQTWILWVIVIGASATLLVFLRALFLQARFLSRVASAEAKAAEFDQLAASQGHELETIFNAATSGIVAVNRKGLVVRANTAARHMLGGVSDPTPFDWPSRIEFLESDTMKPLDRSADPLRRALSGHRLQKETHLMRRLGFGEDRRYVRIESAQLTADRDELVVLVIDDVSNEERNRQAVERKGRLDALGQLTGGIAHDFNNLLTSLLYSIVLAQRTDDEDERKKHLQEAEGSINRGRSLSTRLLAFASKQPGLAESRSVARIFDEFQKLMRPMLEASIELEVDMEHADLIVFCDQTQLESALMNLVLNSRDAMLRGACGNRITLRARAVPASLVANEDEILDAKGLRSVELSVTDNGPGMDAETLARATDPFFTTKDSNSGTGLGLAMVYGFARQSNGEFRIYSERKTGTTVQLTLPRGTLDGFREAPVDDVEVTPGAGQRVLLVEDEMQILSVASKLIKDFGYNVITARSGREALDIAQSGKEFDLLLTDVVMPGEIGGFELARRICMTRDKMPVLYMSGYTGFTSSEMGEVIAPLLQKPTPPVELSRALSLALRTVE